MRLLGEAGLAADLPALDELLPGIEAAPAGHDPDAWLELIGSDLPPALTAALRERRARLRRPVRGRPDHADRLRAAARRACASAVSTASS